MRQRLSPTSLKVFQPFLLLRRHFQKHVWRWAKFRTWQSCNSQRDCRPSSCLLCTVNILSVFQYAFRRNRCTINDHSCATGAFKSVRIFCAAILFILGYSLPFFTLCSDNTWMDQLNLSFRCALWPWLQWENNIKPGRSSSIPKYPVDLIIPRKATWKCQPQVPNDMESLKLHAVNCEGYLIFSSSLPLWKPGIFGITCRTQHSTKICAMDPSWDQHHVFMRGEL